MADAVGLDESFLRHLKRIRSADTVSSYGAQLRGFKKYLAGRKKALAGITRDDVLDYLESKSEWSPASKNIFLAAVKGLAAYCKDLIEPEASLAGMQKVFHEQKRLDLVMKLESQKVPTRKTRKALTPTELSDLLSFAHDNYAPRVWERLWLMFYLGARRCEFYRFDPKTIDLDAGRLVMPTAKRTGEDRVLFFETRVTGFLLGKLKDGSLSFGEDVYTLNKMFEAVRGKFDAGVVITPHVSRHTFNENMRESLGDDLMVKVLMGHTTRSDMTATYSGAHTEGWDAKKKDAMTAKHYMRPLVRMAARWLKIVKPTPPAPDDDAQPVERHTVMGGKL